MKRVSIKDIANRVGVSTAAVSLVLNGKEKEGRVGKAMADKIRQAAREMNYQPNRLARSLQSGHSQTIGLLVADISNPFFGSLAFYIQEEMEKANYAVIIMNTNESDLRMDKMITLLRSHQVDGFIIVPTESGEKYIRPLLDEHVPVVLLDRYYPSIPSVAVIINNYQASYQLTESLIKASCRRIALLIYKNSQPHMLERKRGYEEALRKANIFDPHLVYEVDYTSLKNDVSQAIHTLVEKKNEIDGIVFATNTIAVIGVKQMHQLNIRIPDDIHIATFDKNDAFNFMPVPVPYIQQPISEMSRKAVQLLLAQIEDKKNREFQVFELPAKLVNPL